MKYISPSARHRYHWTAHHWCPLHHSFSRLARISRTYPHQSPPPFGSSCEKVLSANSGPQRGATPVGEINRSWRTPPPLMKLSLWRRANGRLVAMVLIVVLTWGAMITWGFWAQVRFKASHTFGSQSSAFSSYLCNSCITKTCAPLPTANIFPSPALVCIRDHLHRHRRHRHLSHADHPLHQSVCLFFLITQDIRIEQSRVAGTVWNSLACLLFAVTIPSAPYWAFGFTSAILSGIGPDFVYAAGTLYVASVVKPGEQSLAGGLFQTTTRVRCSQVFPPCERA